MIKTIPSQRYARFIHQGPPQELQLTLDYIFHTGLPQSGQNLSQPLVIEYYGRSIQASEAQIYIPIGS